MNKEIKRLNVNEKVNGKVNEKVNENNGVKVKVGRPETFEKLVRERNKLKFGNKMIMDSLQEEEIYNNRVKKMVEDGKKESYIVSMKETKKENEKKLEKYMDKMIADSVGKIDMSIKNKMVGLIEDSLVYISKKSGGYNPEEETYIITSDYEIYKYVETSKLTKNMILNNKRLNEFWIPKKSNEFEVNYLIRKIKELSEDKFSLPKLYNTNYYISYTDIDTGVKVDMDDSPRLYFDIIDSVEKLYEKSEYLYENKIYDYKID